MAGYLDAYGAGDEQRERRIKRIVIWGLAAIVAAAALYFTFNTWRQEQVVKQFFSLLEQKNYQAAASAFRETLDGDLDPKWTEVWSHIYIGKIYDLSGLRDRAMNEYARARETRDNTGGAQDEVAKYTKQAFKLAPPKANP